MLNHTLLTAALCFVLAAFAFWRSLALTRRRIANRKALGHLYRIYALERIMRHQLTRQITRPSR
jgi:hypothetical protein